MSDPAMFQALQESTASAGQKNILHMQVSRVRALRGPNLWSRHTAIEGIVQCEGDEGNIAALKGFEARLRARCPQLGQIKPANPKEVTSLAHALELAVLTLQAEAGCPVTFSRTVKTIEPTIYQVIVEYSEEAVGKRAFELGEQLCLSAISDTPFDLKAALHELAELDEDVRLGPSTGSIVQAAVARGIPYRRLTEGSMVQLGWGSKQRRIQAAETNFTSAIAESIAQDKDLTKELLLAGGVPVPKGEIVDTADDAWSAAERVGLPVVVKPRDGNQGKGVAVNLTTEDQVRAAFEVAYKISDDVIVERYLPGDDYRLLVVGDKLVAAARRDPANVVGDGKHTIEQLVATVNLDPLRGDGHGTSLTKIRLDEIALATLSKMGMSPSTIPAAGQRVVLRNNANLSTGGTATDVTDSVHPEVAAAAVAAAQMVGLDICGVDMVCSTVMKPLEEQGGGIVEVNAAPGLRMHLAPSYGKARDVGKAIIDTMFPEGDNGRIPVIAVAGTNGKTTTVRLSAHLMACMGHRVGMTNSDGVYIENERIDSGDCSGPRSARNVLMHPYVDAAVFETARGGILREGLGFDECDVAIVTNIGLGDHLGLNYISTVEDLAVVKRVIVDNVSPSGMAVLNAADPMVAAMADSCRGSVTYFARDRKHPIMSTHRAQGQRVVYIEGQCIVAAEGKFEYRIPLANIPLTRNGTLEFQVENAMAVVGGAWALNLPWEVIEKGLATFVNDAQTAPGRFNVFDYKGATLIADYGHNPDAIIALVKAIDNMPAQKRVVVISGAGDRRDEDIRQQTQILGDAFDEVILYQDACQRGREDGEVVRLLRQGLQDAKRTRYVQEITGEFLATDHGLSRLGAGDLCLILVDQVDEALAHIAQRVAQATAG